MPIIDEASQVLEPQILGLLCARDAQGLSAIRKFVMIGDHKQLPAVVLLCNLAKPSPGAPRLHAIGLTDMRNSLFQRLHALACTNGQDEIVRYARHRGGCTRIYAISSITHSTRDACKLSPCPTSSVRFPRARRTTVFPSW